MVGIPRLPEKRLRLSKKALDVKSVTSSKCSARDEKHTNRAKYVLYGCLPRILYDVKNSPQKSRPVTRNERCAFRRSLDKLPFICCCRIGL